MSYSLLSFYSVLLLFSFSFGGLPLAGEAAKMRPRLCCWWWLNEALNAVLRHGVRVVLLHALEGRLNLVSGTKYI